MGTELLGTERARVSAFMRTLGLLRGIAVWLGSLLLLLIVFLGAAWMLLIFAVLPHLNDWRVPLERKVSAIIGLPVQSQNITLSSLTGGGSFWQRLQGAVLEVQEIRATDGQGQEAFALARLRLTISLGSLLRPTPALQRIELQAPRIWARQKPQGGWLLAGFDLDAPGSADAVTDWIAAQEHIEISGAQLRIAPLSKTTAPPLTLAGDAHLSNSGLVHRLRLSLLASALLGQGASFSGEFRHAFFSKHPGDWQQWSGPAQLEIPQLSLNALRDFFPSAAGLGGEASLSAQGQWAAGVLRGARLQWRAPQLLWQPPWGTDGVPLSLRDFSTQILAERSSEALRVQVQGLRWTHGGQAWPESNWLIERKAGAQQPWRLQWLLRPGDAAADLAAWQARLTPLVAWLPEAQRSMVQAILAQGRIGGQLQQWQWDWPGAEDWRGMMALAAAGAQWHSQGAVSDLVLRQTGGRPQSTAADIWNASGIALRWEMTPQESTAHFAANAAQIGLSWLPQPVLRGVRLRGQAHWRADAAEALQVQIEEVAHEDTRADIKLTYAPNAGSAAHPLRVLTRIHHLRATRVVRYLPSVLPSGLRQYLQGALRQGVIEGGEYVWQGRIEDFPLPVSARGEPLMQIRAPMRAVEFDYLPDSAPGATWPRVQQANGEVRMAGVSLSFATQSANVLGFPIARIQGDIEDVRAARLQLNLQGEGAAAQALRFVQNSPLAEYTGAALARAEISGDTRIQMDLSLPLDDDDPAAGLSIHGTARLQGNRLRHLLPALPLEDLQGSISFTERGIALHAVQTRALGGQLRMDGKSLDSGALDLSGEGDLAANDLTRWLAAGGVDTDLPIAEPLLWLSQSLSGRSTYRLHLRLGATEEQWQLQSDLKGLAVQLPAPLKKTGGETMSLQMTHLQSTPKNEKGTSGNAAQNYWNIRWGEDGVFWRQRARAAPSLEVRLGRLDLDGWLRWLERKRAQSAAPSEAADTKESSVEIAPLNLTLRLGQLRWLGRNWHDLSLRNEEAQPGSNAPLRLRLQAREIQGRIALQPAAPASQGESAAPLWRVELTKWHWPEEKTAARESARGNRKTQAADCTPSKAATMPAQNTPDWRAEISAQDLRVGTQLLGSAQLSAQGNHWRGQQHWRINALQWSAPGSVLDLKGSVIWPQATVASTLPPCPLQDWDWDWKLTNAGQTLEALGVKDALRDGLGRLKGQARFTGLSPLELPQSLEGQWRLDLANGTLPKVDAGVARLLGILNWEGLWQRLKFDFSDLSAKGLTFTNLGGDFVLQGGQMRTQNLRLNSTIAAALAEGAITLDSQQADFHLVVVPETDLGGAALLYTAINPALGLSAYLAQWIASKPVSASLTREYRVYGALDHLQLEPVISNKGVSSSGGVSGTAASSGASPKESPQNRSP